MGEMLITRIRSIYGDLKGLLSQIPSLKESGVIDEFIVSQLNNTVDNLTAVSGSDYSTYKVPDSQRNSNWPGKYNSSPVRIQLGRVISKLEEEYRLNKETATSAPGIVIFNKNENEMSLKINYTIIDLIKESKNEESKNKLRELQDELNKPQHNWDSIKTILIWILNFSKDLFIKVIPIILQNNQ